MCHNKHSAFNATIGRTYVMEAARAARWPMADSGTRAPGREISTTRSCQQEPARDTVATWCIHHKGQVTVSTVSRQGGCPRACHHHPSRTVGEEKAARADDRALTSRKQRRHMVDTRRNSRGDRGSARRTGKTVGPSAPSSYGAGCVKTYMYMYFHWASQTLLRASRYTQPYGTSLCYKVCVCTLCGNAVFLRVRARV